MGMQLLRTTTTVIVSLAVVALQADESFAAVPRLMKAPQVEDPLAALLHQIQTAPPAAPPAVNNPPSVTVTTPERGFSSDGGSSLKISKINTLITGKIVKDFDAVVQECSQYDPVYRIDCLKKNIDDIIKSLPNNGAYRDARKILTNASRSLDRIVRQNQDTAAPYQDKKSGANLRFKRHHRYRAIKRNKLQVALSQARAVMEEARTQLLRSSENSQARFAHYQAIATAVGSTKVLLRST